MFTGITLPGLVRISLGLENTKEDIDTLVSMLGQIAGKTPQVSTGSQSASPGKGSSPVSKEKVKQQLKDFVEAAALRVYS